jgi:hypothetical protein
MEDVLELMNQETVSSDQCSVRGISMLEQLNRGETVFFTAIGAGLDNNTPAFEDIRWMPHCFQVGNYLRYFMFDFTESFCITRPGEQMLEVRFRKEVYDGFNWMPKKEYVSMNIPILIV